MIFSPAVHFGGHVSRIDVRYQGLIIANIIDLPSTRARIERHTLPTKFNPKSTKRLESIRLTD